MAKIRRFQLCFDRFLPKFLCFWPLLSSPKPLRACGTIPAGFGQIYPQKSTSLPYMCGTFWREILWAKQSPRWVATTPLVWACGRCCWMVNVKHSKHDAPEPRTALTKLRNAEKSGLECNNMRKQSFWRSEDAPLGTKETLDHPLLAHAETET